MNVVTKTHLIPNKASLSKLDYSKPSKCVKLAFKVYISQTVWCHLKLLFYFICLPLHTYSYTSIHIRFMTGKDF